MNALDLRSMTGSQSLMASAGRSRVVVFVSVALALGVAACARRLPAPAPTPAATIRVLETREGVASYYGKAFHGKLTASGRRFDMNAMVAAHPSYPFGTMVRVTNLTNGRQVTVRILDRGPAAGPQADGVIIDLSRGAAAVLGFIRQGRVRVRLDVLEWGDDLAFESEIMG